MGLWTGIAVYFIIWWLSLFLVLPFGARATIDDEDECAQDFERFSDPPQIGAGFLDSRSQVLEAAGRVGTDITNFA